MSPSARTTVVVLVASIVIAAVVLLVRRSTDHGGVAAGSNAAYTDSISAAADLAPVSAGGRMVEVPSPESTDDQQSDAQAPSLEECLTRIAGIESTMLREGASPAAVKELEGVLRLILEKPENLATIIDNLASGTWASEAPDELSATEYGAGRALYWALAVLNQKGSDFFDPERGRSLFNDLLTALPRFDARVQRFLISQVMEVRVDGESLVALFLDDILRMRALLAENRELFSSLLEKLGEEMTAAERDAFFSVFLSDTKDPTLLANTLKNLLRGTSPGAALQLAESIFDNPPGETAAEKIALQKAVAMAVVTGLEDLYSAAQFLETRSERLRNAPEVWFGLGTRDDAFVALDHAYQKLVSVDANPVAREKFVSGMLTASPDQLLRVAEISLKDPDPRVRAQAFMTLTAAESWTPSSVVVRDLRAGLGQGLPTMQVVWAAHNVAQKAANNGSPSVENEALDLLREVALGTAHGAKERQEAAKSLKPFIPSHEYESIIASMK